MLVSPSFANGCALLAPSPLSSRTLKGQVATTSAARPAKGPKVCRKEGW